jgi:hypothetical protein
MTPSVGDCQAGEYEFKMFLDTGNGYWQTDSKTFTVTNSGQGYEYSGSWTCDSVVDDTVEWSKIAVNTRTDFVSGQTMRCLSVFRDVSVNHRIKVDVYKDSVYSWTWGDGNWNTVSGTWAYSNAVVTNSQILVGQYQFWVYFDSGSGYQLIDIKQ